MKIKEIIKIAAATLLIVVITVCLWWITNTVYHFDKAQIMMPDGTIVEGKIENYTKNSDMLRVNIDGVIYYTHAENVVLMSEEN